MANILLTQQCVRSCPYCFAKQHMDDSEAQQRISWEDLIYIADLFEVDRSNHLSLLGGEPTLHPDYVDFVLYLAERKFHVTTFTCGIMSPKRLEEAVTHLKQLDDKQYNFVCNLNHPDMSTDKETERIEAFMKEFGQQTTLSFNIFHLDFDMQYLVDYITKFNLVPHIRLGLAHPIPGENNKIIHPKDFDTMVERLESFMPQMIENNVSVGFDCGFAMCNFTDAQLGKFLRLARSGDGRSIKFVCNPALDIGPDMTVWSCFPLSRYHKKSIYEFNSVQEILEYYRDFHKKVREEQTGIFKECADCHFKECGLCAGGCLAHILNKTEVMPAGQGGAR